MLQSLEIVSHPKRPIQRLIMHFHPVSYSRSEAKQIKVQFYQELNNHSNYKIKNEHTFFEWKHEDQSYSIVSLKGDSSLENLLTIEEVLVCASAG